MMFQLIVSLMLLVAPSLQMASQEPLPSYEEAIHSSRMQSIQCSNRIGRAANVNCQQTQDTSLSSKSPLAIPENCRKDTFFFYVIPEQLPSADHSSKDISRISFGGILITFSDKRTVAYTAVDELFFHRQYYIGKEPILESQDFEEDVMLYFSDQNLRLTDEEVGFSTHKRSFTGTDGKLYSWKTIGTGFLKSQVNRIDLVRYPQKETVASFTFDSKLENGLLEGKLVVKTNRIPENMMTMVLLACAEANASRLKKGNDQSISPVEVTRFIDDMIFCPRSYCNSYST